MSDVRVIHKSVGRLRRRLRAQSAVKWTAAATVIACSAGLVALALYQAWLMPPTAWEAVGIGVASIVGLGMLAGMVRRYDMVSLAARLDDANDLKDRLGTALLILDKPEDQRTEFEAAQVRDAMKHAPGVQHKSAAPWQFPKQLGLAALIAAVAWGVTFAKLAPPEEEEKGLSIVLLPDLPPPARLAGPLPTQPPPVDPELQEDIAAQVAMNTADMEPLAENDKVAMEFVNELNKTLQQLAEGDIDDRALLQKAAELEQALEQMGTDRAAQEAHEQMAENLERIGTEVEKQAEKIKQEELQELGKLLEERKYEQASKKMEELLEKFMKMSPKEQERIAKLFEKLARKFSSKMNRDMQNLRNKRDRLARKSNEKKGGPNKRDRDRLNRMNKRLDRMQRKYNQRNANNPNRKNLDQLTRELKNLADRMRRQRKQNQQAQKQRGQKGEQNRQQQRQRRQRMTREQMKRLTEMMRKMGKQKRRNRMQRMGKMRVADLKELMRRRRGMQGNGRKRLERLARGKRGQKGNMGRAGKGAGDPKRGVGWMKSNKPRNDRTSKGGARDGEGAGHGRDRMLQGKFTDIKGKTVEDFVSGQKGEGPSRKEVLYGAAKQGTRVKGYGKVHIDYSMRAAQQMDREELPPGYREYVEEYFRLIRRR